MNKRNRENKIENFKETGKKCGNGKTVFQKFTLCNALKFDYLRRVINALKPVLTKDNDIFLLKWCLHYVNNRTLEFNGMYFTVLIE